MMNISVLFVNLFLIILIIVLFGILTGSVWHFFRNRKCVKTIEGNPAPIKLRKREFRVVDFNVAGMGRLDPRKELENLMNDGWAIKPDMVYGQRGQHLVFVVWRYKKEDDERDN